MADVELVKRMLRAVLQAQRGGVQGSRLQAQYKELTGELIPHRQMGQPSLDALLASMPSVVRMERSRTGEVVYFASDTNQTTHVAKVMARQRSSKKPGRPLVVDCQMRVKPAAPLVLNAKPRTSLRQPDHRGRGGGQGGGRGGGQGGGRGTGRHGDFKQMRDAQPEGKAGQQSTNQNKPSNQNTPTRKSSGSSERSDKRMTLPSRFHKEVQAHLSRNSPQSSSLSNLNEAPASGKGRPHPPTAYNSQEVQGRIQEVLTKYSNGFWVSKLPQMYKELYKEDLPREALSDLEKWPHICTVEKPCSSNPSELLLYPAKDPPPSPPPASSPPTSSSPTDKHSPAPRRPPTGSPPPLTPPLSSTGPLPSPPSPPASLSPDLEQKLGELLLKYSNGLWAHALPKLFQDTYKTTLPDYVLQNLSLLSTFCSVDYPMPDNPKRAILYRRTRGGGGGGGEDGNRNCPGQEERRVREEEEVGRRSSKVAPPLVIPREEYPSVLVVEASSTNAVVLRYIGEGYSQAQETLEDEMREFYRQDNQRRPLTCPASGQLAAVRAEEEDEILRAQVTEVMADKVKVFYVDHGFSEVVSKGKVFELHDQFIKLPLQATKCKLAGLEPFCQEPAVLKKLDAMASGRILLAEILEREQTPLVVLYDTSQDDDVNINTTCMKALQDKSMASPLQVNSAYMDVTVSSVCSDGTIYCQLRSRGLAKLTNILDKTEAYFNSQVTSECLVARPFCGKSCLARYKGKWCRVEITNLHGSRVLDILFVDLGVQASVEVFELREIPPPFLKDLVTIPPQAVKCCLSDLMVPVGSWTPEAVQWLRDAVLNSTDCSMKISKMDDTKRCAHVHLFPDKNFQDPTRSLNHQLATSDLFKHHRDVFLSSHAPPTPSPAAPLHPPSTSTPKTPTTNGSNTPSSSSRLNRALSASGPSPSRGCPPRLPALLELPQVGQNLDVYVSVACHPGHFVLQPWRDMYKLVILMGEMILYYNKMEDRAVRAEKNQVYAAKVENNWHRVLVKGVLTNGLVSVYELDYGRHELVSANQLRPLIKEFLQLPFQGITAQLAGVKQRQWSEAASIVFRNHVEKKPLVAQLEAEQEAELPWDRKLTVFLVDTSQEERDVWVHDIMAEFATEP